MKKRFSIGLLTIGISCLMLTAAYQLSYTRALQKFEAQHEKQTTAVQEVQTVETKGNAEKESGYYLAERNGYVVVYLADKSAIYEYTDILVDSLPAEVQKEVRAWKYIPTPEVLYGFLENYTS